jgi:phosphocarrier protein FPr
MELARGMAGPDVLLALAGGLALPGQPLGTDASLILEAIQQVYSDDGVLVLMDLGSALLSTEMAVEQLPPEKRAHIALCEGPLVEGALAAAVQARIGGSLEQVIAEARGSLAAKAAHLLAEVTIPVEITGARQRLALRSTANDPYELALTVSNPHGLHTRPAARFVQIANRFPLVDIFVKNVTTGRGPANAKSINALASLGVRQGHEILVLMDGPDAQSALTAVRALADDNFGDNDDAVRPIANHGRKMIPQKTLKEGLKDHPATFLQGLPASPGIALGVAHILRREAQEISMYTVADTDTEWNRLSAALKKTRRQIQDTRAKVRRRVDADIAAIFDAHILFLEDDALLQPAKARIFSHHLNAAAAWHEAAQSVIAEYEGQEDDYLRQRAADVRAVAQQVLLNLLDGEMKQIRLNEPCILLTDDLTPAETVQLQPDTVLAICTVMGGPTSHSAILARTFSIPAVVGVREVLLSLENGTNLVVDGDSGQIFPNPDAQLRAEYTQRATANQKIRAAARAASGELAITRDRHRVKVVANIGSVEDAQHAAASGAEGVGLFRTEFLFLDHHVAPDEDEQFTAYKASAQAMQGRSMIIRTLDIGGDKPLPYIKLSHEDNPFLGQRAIRLCLAEPELFKTQLRAVLRVAAEFPVKLMFPMIATLTEWRAAYTLLDEARAELISQQVAVPDHIETGIMVEIPSAAIQAVRFAAEVDFFSIGTNDLTQYTLAAERGNARVAALSNALQPAVLKLITEVVEAAHAHGKWVGVCGELAGDPLAIPLLVGLGVDELSMNAPSIPVSKQIIRALNYGTACINAQDILDLDTAEAVREQLRLQRG